MSPGRRHTLRTLRTLGLAAAAPWAAARVQAAPAQIGEVVAWPERVPLLDGRTLSAAQLRERPALVVFFSTTCPFCARHNEHLAKLVREPAVLGLRGLRVLGVAQDRDADTVRRYLEAKGLPIEATLHGAPLHAALSERRVIPLTCAVDRAGRLREVIPGEMFEEDVLALARWAGA